MNATDWKGPNGTVVTLRTGSRMPPRWALLLIDRVLRRERRGSIELRWTNSTRGGRGMAYGPYMISVGAAPGNDDRTRYVVIHELAHAVNRRGDRHGDGFYDALVRIASEEGCLRLVEREHSVSHAKAPLRRAKARAKEVA